MFSHTLNFYPKTPKHPLTILIAAALCWTRSHSISMNMIGGITWFNYNLFNCDYRIDWSKIKSVIKVLILEQKSYKFKIRVPFRKKFSLSFVKSNKNEGNDCVVLLNLSIVAKLDGYEKSFSFLLLSYFKGSNFSVT